MTSAAAIVRVADRVPAAVRAGRARCRRARRPARRPRRRRARRRRRPCAPGRCRAGGTPRGRRAGRGLPKPRVSTPTSIGTVPSRPGALELVGLERDRRVGQRTDDEPGAEQPRRPPVGGVVVRRPGGPEPAVEHLVPRARTPSSSSTGPPNAACSSFARAIRCSTNADLAARVRRGSARRRPRATSPRARRPARAAGPAGTGARSRASASREGLARVDERVVDVEQDPVDLRAGRHGARVTGSRAARRSRASVDSRPSSSIDSNSGGETRRPVTATRSGV